MIAEFTEKQPEYKYMEIGEYADVMIFKYIGEKKIESNGKDQLLYEYDVNIFRCIKEEISEDMIKNDIDYYFNFETKKKEYYTKDEVDNLIKKILSALSANINY